MSDDNSDNQTASQVPEAEQQAAREKRMLYDLQICQYALNKIMEAGSLGDAQYIATFAIVHTAGYFPPPDISLEIADLDINLEEWKAQQAQQEKPGN